MGDVISPFTPDIIERASRMLDRADLLLIEPAFNPDLELSFRQDQHEAIRAILGSKTPLGLAIDGEFGCAIMPNHVLLYLQEGREPAAAGS